MGRKGEERTNTSLLAKHMREVLISIKVKQNVRAQLPIFLVARNRPDQCHGCFVFSSREIFPDVVVSEEERMSQEIGNLILS
jgi:hypothetical protein